MQLALYKQGLPGELCELKLVYDVEQAIAVYKEWTPDIILLDYNMPLLNGYQALKAIRVNEQDQSTTIIMVTSIADKSDIVACAKLGIQGYIMKPFSPSEIARRVFTMHKAHNG